MNKKQLIKTYSLLLINLFIFISSLIITILGVSQGAGAGQLGEEMYGVGYFKAFTVDSNILSGIASLILTIYIVLILTKKITKIPSWVKILLYSATTCVTLTMLTVIFFLAPVNGFNEGISSAIWFFSNDMFFFHLLNPLLAIINFFLLEINKKYTYKENIIAIIPMAIYTIFYLVAVLTNFMSDFYGFTFGGKNYLIPLVIIVMLGITYLIGFILRIIKNKIINPFEII